ncbi:MAG: hypothetical protein ABFD94_15445 [Armatimonadia bacterium]
MTSLADVQVPITVAGGIVATGLTISWAIFSRAEARAKAIARAAMRLHENTYHGTKHEDA